MNSIRQSDACPINKTVVHFVHRFSAFDKNFEKTDFGQGLKFFTRTKIGRKSKKLRKNYAKYVFLSLYPDTG